MNGICKGEAENQHGLIIPSNGSGRGKNIENWEQGGKNWEQVRTGGKL